MENWTYIRPSSELDQTQTYLNVPTIVTYHDAPLCDEVVKVEEGVEVGPVQVPVEVQNRDAPAARLQPSANLRHRLVEPAGEEVHLVVEQTKAREVPMFVLTQST